MKNAKQIDELNPFENQVTEMSADKLFTSEGGTPSDVAKELFLERLVKARTRLSPRQIQKITLAYHYSDVFGMEDMKEVLNDFITLKISEKGKSREEFVTALQHKLDNTILQGGTGLRQQFNR